MGNYEQITYTELFADRPISDIPRILAGYMVLQELDLGFTKSKTLQIARDEVKGYRIVGAIRKTREGLQGKGGFSIADIENAAQMLGVYEEVLDYDY